MLTRGGTDPSENPKGSAGDLGHTVYGPMWPGEEGNEVSEKATGAADSSLGHNFLRLYVIVGYRSHSEFKELKNGHYLSWVLVSTLLSKSCVISETYAQLVVPWLYLL